MAQEFLNLQFYFSPFWHRGIVTAPPTRFLVPPCLRSKRWMAVLRRNFKSVGRDLDWLRSTNDPFLHFATGRTRNPGLHRLRS